MTEPFDFDKALRLFSHGVVRDKLEIPGGYRRIK